MAGRWNPIGIGAVVLGVGLALTGTRPGSSAPLSRAEFARHMAQVREGMPQERVLELLGRPDDVITREDPQGFVISAGSELWSYGTHGHGTFPTLGQLHMVSGKVDRAFGSRGKPPEPGLLPESQLRELLPLLDRVPALHGDEFDPLPLIQAVNRLQPLGKQRALAAIREYLRVCPSPHPLGKQGQFLVLRLLFEVPKDPGYMPRMWIGAPGPASPPTDLKRGPHFPLRLTDDVPLLLISGYMLAGYPEPPESHLEYFEQHGTLRRAPLRPTDRPFEVLEKIERSPEWTFNTSRDPNPEGAARLTAVFGAQTRSMLINQLVRLVRTAYVPSETDRADLRLAFGADARIQAAWERIRADAAKQPMRWDPVQNCYTQLDGTRRPEPPPPRRYRRFFWDPPLPLVSPTVMFQRVDAEWVVAQIHWTNPGPDPALPAEIDVYPAEDRQRRLAGFHLAAGKLPASGSSSGTRFRLPEGLGLVAELSNWEGKLVSPIIKP